METYARGIPTYKGENGQTIGLLCETKEQCVTDDDGVRLSDKLASMQQQIEEGPDTSNFASEEFVNNAVSGLATEEYVDTAVSDKATTAYVDAAVSNASGGNADTVDEYHAIDFIIRRYETKRDIDLLATAEDDAICPAMSATRFRAFTPINAPVEDSDFFIEVQKIDGTWIKVIATTVRSNYEYSNVKSSGIWQGWKCGAYADEVLPLNGSMAILKLNDNDGGRLLLEKPTSAAADGNLAIDFFSNYGVPYARFVENGGNYRGAYIDLSKCEYGGRGWGSEIFHTGNSSPCVVVATDPGVGASVSYANGTLLFVKGA